MRTPTPTPNHHGQSIFPTAAISPTGMSARPAQPTRTDTRSSSTVAVGCPAASGARKGTAQPLRLIGKVFTAP